MKNQNITIKSINSLSVFRNLLSDDVVGSLVKMYDESDMCEMASLCGKIYSSLLQNNCTSVADYVINFLQRDCNPLSTALASSKQYDTLELSVSRAKQEYSMLQKLSQVSQSNCLHSFDSDFLKDLPTFDCGTFPPFESLIDNYQNFGFGTFSESVAFLWNTDTKTLEPVKTINPIRLVDLKNYTQEKDEIIANTLNFINSRPALNALLYGDRGTGKSSTISAMLNEFSAQGLRIIELSKSGIADLPLITKQIANLKFKFLIFIDDLSFTSGSDDYAMLKATLEGSVNKPSNTLIYATSNRRHLIAESHAERSDDVHAGDTMQEQLSLADRFGLVVTFLSTDKKEFLSILQQILDDHNYKYDEKELSLLAEKEAIRKGGRSPRLASQIASQLLSKSQN